MKTNLLTLVVTLTLGIILAGSLLMPVITDAQTNLGNPTTITNDGLYNMGWQDSVTIEIEKDGTNVNITINGESFVPTTSAATPILLTKDVFVGAYLAAGSAVSVGTRFTDPNNIVQLTANTLTASASITVENEHITIVKDSDTILDADCGKTLAVKENGEYTVVTSSNFNKMKIATDKDVIFMGAYYTGDLDCFYDTYAGTAGTYTITAQITKSAMDGTTDLFDVTTGTVTISDGIDSETFTPFYGMFKASVNGHESAGGAYSLLGALPIIVIIGLVLAGVSAIFIRNRD